MKKILFILLILILPFAFSSCDEETPTEVEEVVMTGISCLDSENHEIASIEYVINQTEYVYKNVYIYASYSDGTTGNVTPYVTFSEIDLTTVGEKKVEVSYKGFKDSFIVNVIEIELDRIQINIDNVKTIYGINEELNIDGLKVYSVLSDGTFSEIKDYKVILYDDNSNEIDDKIIYKEGTYLVQVIYKNKYDYYNVYSYKNEYNYALVINTNELNNVDLKGDFTYVNNDIIYENDFCSFVSNGEIILNTLDNNNEISFNYFNYNFNYAININNSNGLIFESKKDFEMVIIIEGINFNGELEIVNLESKNIEYYYLKDKENTLIFIEGNRDLYEIKSFNDLKIKGVVLNVNEELIFQGIKLDTDLVKKIYQFNEELSFENLAVFGMLNETDFIEIPLSSCEFSLMYNGEYVDVINKIGLYEVEVKYTNKSTYVASYNIEVKAKMSNYDYLNLDLTNVQTIFEADEAFNYDGLLVYGINSTTIELIELLYCDIKLYFNDGTNDYEVVDFISKPGLYYVIVSYTNLNVNLTKKYDIYYNLGIISYEDEVVPIIEILSNGNIKLNVENVLSTIVDVKISIYNNGVLVTNVNSLNTTIANLDVSKKYSIKGYYTGRINNELYVVYLSETSIDFSK